MVNHDKKAMKAIEHWWVKPHLLLFLFILPIYVLIYFSGSGTEDTHNYFSSYYFMLGLLYLVILGLSALFGQRLQFLRVTQNTFQPNTIFLDIIAGLTIAAYIIWFGEILYNPQLILNVLTDQSANLRTEISTIPGVTTFTQLGVVFAIYYTYCRWAWKNKLPTRFKYYFYIIIILTAFRTVAWSERLGLIELILPIMLIYLSSKEIKRPILKFIVLLGPFAGVATLVVFFSVAEYFRSWLAWAQYGSKDFVTFMLDRIYAYYYNSLNDGAGFLTEFPWPELKGQYTFSWIYGFPVIGGIITDMVGLAHDSVLYMDVYGQPGFTTFTGIFPVFYDFGIVGALVYAILFGGLSGLFYCHFKNRYGIGMVIFPMFFVGMAEILRIPYLGTTRIFPIFLFLIIGYFMLRKTAGTQKSENG